MDVSDEDLARAAAGGDARAFATLLERRYDGLYRLCFRLTGSCSDAEDLTQDICLALPQKLHGWRGQARFTTWLYRVAVNAAHDRRRRMAAHSRAAAGWGEVELARAAEGAELAGNMAWLGQMMARLPEPLRDTLALVMEDELSHAEAGDALGVSEGTISWRMSEIRKQLREFAALEATQ